MMTNFPWYATELFLQVCYTGGLSAASRFGQISISQPALSAQMMSLEQNLGIQLFERKPFQLTREGRIFQEEALKIRSRMELLRESVTAEKGKRLRIAASDVIIRDYLPQLLRAVDVPLRTQMLLQEAPSQDLAGLVRDDEVDLAIGMMPRRVEVGASPLVEIIASLPMLLRIPPSYVRRIKSWADLIEHLKKGERLGLIGLAHNNLLMMHIHSALRKHGVEWHTSLEVSSFGHILPYVELDFGFGFGFCISTDVKQLAAEASNTIFLSHEEMPPLSLGVWHRENMDPLALRLLAHIRNFAKIQLSVG